MSATVTKLRNDFALESNDDKLKTQRVLVMKIKNHRHPWVNRLSGVNEIFESMDSYKEKRATVNWLISKYALDT